MAYSYAPGRGGAYGENIIEGFGGILQVDGYTGYNRLTKDGRQGAPIELAYCWAHVRRKLYDVAKKNHAPIAEEGPRRIAELYRIEATIKGQRRRSPARCPPDKKRSPHKNLRGLAQ